MSYELRGQNIFGTGSGKVRFFCIGSPDDPWAMGARPPDGGLSFLWAVKKWPQRGTKDTKNCLFLCDLCAPLWLICFFVFVIFIANFQSSGICALGLTYVGFVAFFFSTIECGLLHRASRASNSFRAASAAAKAVSSSGRKTAASIMRFSEASSSMRLAISVTGRA